MQLLLLIFVTDIVMRINDLEINFVLAVLVTGKSKTSFLSFKRMRGNIGESLEERLTSLEMRIGHGGIHGRWAGTGTVDRSRRLRVRIPVRPT